MNTMLEEVKTYFRNTPQDQIDKDWAEYAKYDQIGPKVDELLCHFESFFQFEDDPVYIVELKNPSNIKSPSYSDFFFIH
ncbi:MAG: hypothetical protein A3D31_12815 [Candidatus Fluviicola riflensis]|nr:MAG: hypothetical protein CHH17_17255 [Candidatus Fluviicola riflensis]OGS77865.1 MAG: hypothetical protein A3D31_12815 [Candidatus Fluviicola riflensis]OGS84930.1 MAG: hypothetical protein A2724_09750 [Fluviicola sp. RIFCSPHIGHO2_01_FULL_43_53]OGS89202.1 MAG: hypothetical protein A3E30_04055 [Fluviicola sp. RIFCSPHIGHO2_12_FULL_43_24]